MNNVGQQGRVLLNYKQLGKVSTEILRAKKDIYQKMIMYDFKHVLFKKKKHFL